MTLPNLDAFLSELRKRLPLACAYRNCTPKEFLATELDDNQKLLAQYASASIGQVAEFRIEAAKLLLAEHQSASSASD